MNIYKWFKGLVSPAPVESCVEEEEIPGWVLDHPAYLQLPRGGGRETSLFWIFRHGEEVLANPQPSIATLAKGLGITDQEVGYLDSLGVLIAARPFLKAGDELGWLEYCKRHEGELK